MRDTSLSAVRTSRVLFGALVVAQLGYPRVPARREVAATRGIVGILLGASVADAVERRGKGKAAVLTGTAAAVGMVAEWCGVATGRPFGHYHYSSKLGPKVGEVPVLAAACWTMMARPAWVTAGLVTRRRGARAALAAAGLTAWDVYLDPRMVREGYWRWPRGGRYEGVPASNFAGWFATGSVVFGLWAVLDGEDAPGPADDLALALFCWTWVGEAVANVLFWGRPRVAAAGGLAMGAVAVPALRARAGAARG